MKRVISITSLLLLFALVFAIPVLAGGWAVITLDELPGQIVTGEPLEIGFMVRQHGRTPMSGLTPTITARLTGSNETIRASAQAEGKVGHYVAVLTLPQAGEWRWAIEAFTMNQPMPPLTVLANTLQTANASPKPTLSSLFLLAVAIGLVGAVSGLLALKKKARWALALVAIGLLLSGAGLASAVDQPLARSEAQQKPSNAPPSVSQVELGRQLFIAKGCLTCHYHSETAADREFGVDIGPNLTNFSASPEYLRMWLADPQSVRSAAEMPNLGLSEVEIEALIAFVNEK